VNDGPDDFDGFEWNEEKNKVNRAQRHLDFADAALIFDDIHIYFEDARQDYGEVRNIAIGVVDGNVLVVAWTPRGRNRRIISARLGNKAERLAYRDFRQSY